MRLHSNRSRRATAVVAFVVGSTLSAISSMAHAEWDSDDAWARRKEVACQSVASLALDIANDHENGISLYEEEQRYNQQARSQALIEWVYKASDYERPKQVQSTAYSACLQQLRHSNQ